MWYSLFTILTFLGTAPPADSRRVTVSNQCKGAGPNVLWLGVDQIAGPVWNDAQGYRLFSDYYEDVEGMGKGTFEVPDGWKGRIFPRALCTTNNGVNDGTVTIDPKTDLSCLDDGKSATGVYLEINENSSDKFVVTLDRGFNLPMRVQANGTDCPVSECSKNLNIICPNEVCDTMVFTWVSQFQEINMACRNSGSCNDIELFRRNCPKAALSQSDLASANSCTPGAAGIVITLCPNGSEFNGHPASDISAGAPPPFTGVCAATSPWTNLPTYTGGWSYTTGGTVTTMPTSTDGGPVFTTSTSTTSSSSQTTSPSPSPPQPTSNRPSSSSSRIASSMTTTSAPTTSKQSPSPTTSSASPTATPIDPKKGVIGTWGVANKWGYPSNLVTCGTKEARRLTPWPLFTAWPQLWIFLYGWGRQLGKFKKGDTVDWDKTGVKFAQYYCK